MRESNGLSSETQTAIIGSHLVQNSQNLQGQANIYRQQQEAYQQISDRIPLLANQAQENSSSNPTFNPDKVKISSPLLQKTSFSQPNEQLKDPTKLKSVQDLLSLLRELPQKKITINGIQYDLDLTMDSSNIDLSQLDRISQASTDQTSQNDPQSKNQVSPPNLQQLPVQAYPPPNFNYKLLESLINQPNKEGFNLASMNFSIPGALPQSRICPPKMKEFILPPPLPILQDSVQPAQDQSPPTSSLPMQQPFLQRPSLMQQNLISAPPLSTIDMSTDPTTTTITSPSTNFSAQLKKTRSEIHPQMSTRHHSNQSSTQYMQLMFQNVSSKYIVGANNERPHMRNIEGIVKENEELQKKLEEQQSQISQLKEIQSKLSTFVIQHSTMQNIFKNIQDENILEILSQAQVSNANIHLSFLFASPLVIYDSKQDKFNEIDQIDHYKEFNGVFESLESTGKLIKYQKVQATLNNLTQTLTENPIALHFSGHGFKEKKLTQSIRGAKAPLNGYLVIEDEKGQSNFLPAQSLKNMIKSQGSKPEFVFVASCYSQFAGQIFHQAGAKHVICVKESYQISDDASIIFTKVFYKALFSSNKTVCEAFNIAKSHLENHEDVSIAKESEKFMILRSTDQEDELDPTKLRDADLFTYGYSQTTKTKKHQCTIFGPFAEGQMTNKCHVPMFRMETSKVEDFLGRTPEMHQVISYIQNKRIVNVMGIPGIGKTTLIKAIAHYLDERLLFKDGIIMLSLRNLDQASMILTRLELIINKKVKDFLSSAESSSQDQKEGKTVDQRALLEKITNFFKDKVILLVLDNAETPSKKDPKNFAEIIQSLLDHCPHLKFLFTSRYNIGSFENNAEQVIELKELQMRYAVDLLKRKSPRPIEQDEIEELLRIKPEKVLHFNPFKRDDSKGGLENHHMFEILKGHPHAISLAAPLLQNKKLKELYELLNSDEIMNWLENQGIKDTPMSSLKVSMDISIKQLSETEPQAIKIFWLIGLMPGGCNQNDLNVLWGQGWINEIEKLLRASLLVKKSVANENIFQLFPFMNQYASTNMNIKEKKDLHNKISKHLIELCKDLLKLQSFEARIDRLVSIETNIWACIYRMRDNEIESRARSPAVSFWQNPSNRATPISSSILKHSNNQSDNGSSSLNNRPSALSDTTKQGPNQPTVEESSSIGDNNLMMMGLDNLSSENILTDFFDNILSKRFVSSGFSTYGKERSKSEKVVKNMRGSEIQAEEEEVKDGQNKEQEEERKSEEIMARLDLNQVAENNQGANMMPKDDPDDIAFIDQLIIHHQPSLVRRSSLESQEQKRFESLLSNQSSNFMKGNLNNSFSANLQVYNISDISQNQMQGNSGFISFNANNQLLDQSFRVDLKVPRNNQIGASHYRPQNFNDDASQINGGQFHQSQDQLDNLSLNSFDNQILSLNTTQLQIQPPSFLNLNSSVQSIGQQQPQALDQSNFLFNNLSYNKKQPQNVAYYGRMPPQQTPEIIPEESMMSYAEDDFDQKSPDVGVLQHKESMLLLNIDKQESCQKEGEESKTMEKQVSVRSIHKITSSFSEEEGTYGFQVPKSETENSNQDSDQEVNLQENQNMNSEKDQENHAPPPSISLADNLLKDIQQNYLDETMDSDCLNKDLDQITKFNAENNQNHENSSKLDSYYAQEASKNQTANNSSLKKNETIKKDQRAGQISKRVTIQEDLPENSQKHSKMRKDTSSSKKDKNKSQNRQPPSITLHKVTFSMEHNQTLMTIDGCLMVYYITNLLLIGRIEDALKVIEQFGLKLDNDRICQANIKKMQAYAEAKNGNYLNAKKKYEEALQIFNQYNSIHGQAICNYSIGFLLYSQTTHFIKSANENKIFDQAKKKLEIAISCFNKIQHLSGESECHRFLIFIKKKNKENIFELFERQKALMKDENRLQIEGRSSFIFLHQQIEISLQLEIVGASPITVVSNIDSQKQVALQKPKTSGVPATLTQPTKGKKSKLQPVEAKKIFKNESTNQNTVEVGEPAQIINVKKNSQLIQSKPDDDKRSQSTNEQFVSQIPRTAKRQNKEQQEGVMQSPKKTHKKPIEEAKAVSSSKAMMPAEIISEEPFENEGKSKRQRVKNDKPTIYSQNNTSTTSQNLQKKFAFGTTVVTATPSQKLSAQNNQNLNASRINQNPYTYKKQEAKKQFKEEEESKNHYVHSTAQSDNGATSEEDEQVMNLQEKTSEQNELEKLTGKANRRGNMSNDNDKSFIKGSLPTRNTLKPSPSVNSLSTRKQKHEDLSHISRPQSPNVSKMIKSKIQNKSLTNLNSTTDNEGQQSQQDSQQKVVQFNITTTTTVTIEGGTIPNSIMIGPSLQLGSSQE